MYLDDRQQLNCTKSGVLHCTVVDQGWVLLVVYQTKDTRYNTMYLLYIRQKIGLARCRVLAAGQSNYDTGTALRNQYLQYLQ